MRLFLIFCFFLLPSLSFSYTLEPCTKISFHKSQNKLNLIFSPLNYSSKKSFSRDVDILLKRLKQTPPFAEFMDRVSIWRIKLSQSEEKVFFKPAQDIPPLLVRQDFMDGISNHLNSNYKLILIDGLGSVSCAELSSPDKISLIILGKNRYENSQSFAKGFLHELGHSLGLRDECIDCAQLCAPGEPNCASNQKEAERLWGDLAVGDLSARVSYINGCCGNPDYIRPTIASLMNDPDKAEDFGPVNERYLRSCFDITF
jgi:hypothetical protein